MSTFQSWRRRLIVGAVTATFMIGLQVTAAAPAQALSGFGNGSFETPTAPPGSFVNLGAGASIGPWTVSQGHVDHIGAGFWQAADGVQSVDLDGSSNPVTGGVVQTFSTLALLKYKVTYKLAGNPASGPTVKTGQVLAEGNLLQNISFDITGKSFANMGYVGKTTFFVANGSTTTLEFRSTTGSGYGPVIDDVDVEACLLIICLG